MNTTENNKLIAEFLGWRLGHPELLELRWSNEWFHNGYKKTQKGFLFFDSNWNWLMEVVEKIDNTRTITSIKESYLYCVSLEGGSANIIDGKTGEVIVEIVTGVSWIETTYKLVVEFIKWYNQQNK